MSSKQRAEISVMANALYDHESGRITARDLKATIAVICSEEEAERVLKINVMAYTKDELFAAVAKAYLSRH